MPVQTIECHIAAVLMKRFLDGDNLPENLVADLETHVKACESCRSLLNQEKLSMEEVLDGVPERGKGFAGVLGKLGLKPVTAGGFTTAYPTEALVAASRTSYTTTGGGMAAFKNPKVLFLSGALAIVLIAMSTILKDPTSLLGSRAGAVFPARMGDDPDKGAILGGDDEDGSGVTDEPEGHEGDGDETVLTDDDLEAVSSGGGVPSASARSTEGRDLTQTPRAGTVVPGERTIDESNVVIVGGESPAVTKPGAGQSGSAGAKSSGSGSSASSAPVKKSSGGGTRTNSSGGSSSGQRKSGIRVYDQNGKPIP